MRMVLIEVLAPKLVPFHYWINSDGTDGDGIAALSERVTTVYVLSS